MFTPTPVVNNADCHHKSHLACIVVALISVDIMLVVARKYPTNTLGRHVLSSTGFWSQRLSATTTCRMQQTQAQRLFSSRNDSSTGGDDSNQEGPFTKVLSTVRHFNNGLSRLKSDFLISLHIRDADESRIHLNRKLDKLRRTQNVKDEDTCLQLVERRQKLISKHLPRLTTRRSARHVVQIRKDLQTTLPTVLGFLIPVAGYAFLILGVMFPKVLLSRQFHTKEQRREFAMDEFGFRQSWFGDVSRNFWGSFMTTQPKVDKVGVDSAKMDAAGPVLNETYMLHLYELCHKAIPSVSQTSNAFSGLPIAQLHSLALACNLPSILPFPAAFSSELLRFCFPRKFLETRLTAMAEDIIVDDATLIEEGNVANECSNLTDDEVMSACLARGLPVGRFTRDAVLKEQEADCMKRLLTNHLKMIQYVMMVRETMSIDGHNLMTGGVGIGSKRSLVRDHALQLLVLHLAAIRCEMKPQTERTVAKIHL